VVATLETWRNELGEVELVKHALAYARKGWAVFPLWWPAFPGECSCRDGGKCSSAGKHPLVPKGPHAATHNEEAIKAWWRKWPNANIGIATGWASGFDVLDVDPDHGGGGSMKRLLLEHGPPAQTLVSITGSGGRHILWKHRKETKQSQGILPGIDIRTTGGYIVAPPSMHACGERYRWHDRGHPRSVRLLDSPEWAAELMSRTPVASAGETVNDSKPMPEGSRNVSLFKLACRWQRFGWSDEKISDQAHIMNRKLCKPPLPTNEVEKIVSSVTRYPKGT
jgi:hypothetical protein